MSETEISAWIMDDGLWVVYGTHNPKKAGKAMEAYLVETGYAQIWDKPTRQDLYEEFRGADKFWTRPVDDGIPFETFTHPGPNRTPYMTRDGQY